MKLLTCSSPAFLIRIPKSVSRKIIVAFSIKNDNWDKLGANQLAEILVGKYRTDLKCEQEI